MTSLVFISSHSFPLFSVRFRLFSLFVPSVILIEKVPQMFPPVSPLVVVRGPGVVQLPVRAKLLVLPAQ